MRKLKESAEAVESCIAEIIEMYSNMDKPRAFIKLQNPKMSVEEKRTLKDEITAERKTWNLLRSVYLDEICDKYSLNSDYIKKVMQLSPIQEDI